MTISINEDIRHIVEAELQPGEELLWASAKHAKPQSKLWLWFTRLFWILLLLLASVAGAGLGMTAKANGSWAEANVWFLASILPLVGAFALAKSFITSPTTANPSTYVITNNRLVVLSDNGQSRRTLTGRAFHDMEFKTDGKLSTIHLTSAGEDESSIYVTLEKIESGAVAERLLREKFMKRNSP